MRCLSVFWALGLALCAKQGAQAQGFNRRYDATGYGFTQNAWGIEQAGNGWMVFSGSNEPDTLSADSIWSTYRIILQRIDGNGQLLEEQRISKNGHAIYLGWADCCDTVASGGYVIGGSSLSYSGVSMAQLIRLDANGDTLWTRSYGESGHFMSGNQVKQTADGGFLIVGWYGPYVYYDDSGFVIKTDSLGNEEWRQLYGLPGLVLDAFSDIALLQDGYVLGGGTFPSIDDCDFLVTRITNTGTELWSARFGSPYKEPNASVEVLQDGHILVAGAWAVNADGYESPYMALLDSTDGQVVWEHQYGPAMYGKTFFATKQLPNTDLIACGVTYDGGYEQGLLLRTTANGDSLWMRNYAYHDSVIDQGQGRFWDVLPTEDGGCIAAGVAYNPFGGPYPPGYSQDAWVVKVDSMGCIVPGCDGVGITEQVTNLGDALRLWPNPVSGQLHVGLSLPGNFKTTGPLTLSVTTLDGRLVLRQQLPPLLGRGAGGEGILDVSALAAGTYALHLSDGTRWLAGSKFVVQ